MYATARELRDVPLDPSTDEDAPSANPPVAEPLSELDEFPIDRRLAVVTVSAPLAGDDKLTRRS